MPWGQETEGFNLAERIGNGFPGKAAFLEVRVELSQVKERKLGAGGCVCCRGPRFWVQKRRWVESKC